MSAFFAITIEYLIVITFFLVNPFNDLTTTYLWGALGAFLNQLENLQCPLFHSALQHFPGSNGPIDVI
jgi:hypothetical protein